MPSPAPDTTKFLFVCGAIAGAAALVILSVGAFNAPQPSTFDPEKITCLPAPKLVRGLIPPVDSTFDTMVRPAEADIDYFRRPLASSIDAALKAVAICSPSDCPRASKAEYLAKTSQYLNARQNMVRRLLRTKGDYGLRIAHDVSSTLQDQDIVSNLQDLHRSKQIDLEDFGPLKFAAALLATKPERDFQPCSDEPQ